MYLHPRLLALATQLVGVPAGDAHNGHEDHRLGPPPDKPDVNPHHHH